MLRCVASGGKRTRGKELLSRGQGIYSMDAHEQGSRAGQLTNQSHQKYLVYSSYVPALLNQRHPSQRIAFWTARWAWQLGLTENSTFDLAIEHLLSLSKQEIFQKEAPGIILACELLDLKHRGCIDFDAEGFLTVVLGNSSETTQQWVAQHPPDEDDWLAPLTYNYR